MLPLLHACVPVLGASALEHGTARVAEEFTHRDPNVAQDNHFNDLNSAYDSGPNYLCSTNDKLGPGLWNDGEPCVGHGCSCRPTCTNP